MSVRGRGLSSVTLVHTSSIGSRDDVGDRCSTAGSCRDSMSDDHEDGLRFVVVGQKLKNNVQLQDALQTFRFPVLYSDTGFEYMKDSEDETMFVVENFDGTIFQSLYREGCRIVAPPVIIKSASEGMGIPMRTRPLFCLSMDRLVLCFSGFKTKEELSRLAILVHRMGGGIRKDFSANVTHLVANRSGGEKYRAAVSMGTDIMAVEWIDRLWELRNEVDVFGTDDEMMQYKLRPFSFSTLSFYGFSGEETLHMGEVTVSNGGRTVEPGHASCTHLVINEQDKLRAIPFELSSKVHIVKSEWLWASVQMDACADEAMYAYEEPMDEAVNDHGAGRRTPRSAVAGSKSYKRRKLKENLAQLAYEGEVDTPMFRRKSSIEVPRRSLSVSFLDASSGGDGTVLADATLRDNNSPDISLGPTSSTHLNKDSLKLTPRQQTIMELFQTEKNYVGILHTILKVFKEEIEKVDQPGGPILDPQESKAIFGGIPPIYDVHIKIRDELSEITTTWNDLHSVGNVFLKHAEELSKWYPNFINYFEKTKETVATCDRTKPRFHAFLKLCQSRAECGRQLFTELLIRPVQRLPSVMLLLRDIMKREKTHPDCAVLEQAISALEEVMTHINEDKRKTEGHQVMFEIINDIENCPPNLLSAHRSFVRRVDTVEVSDELSGKGDAVTLFVFSDSIELCKRRVKVLMAKSPGSNKKNDQQKAYKHLSLIQFSSVKRVVDICDTEECRGVFALIVKKIEDKEENLYSFMIVDRSCDKEEFLTCLSKTICTNLCRTDYETLLAAVESHVLAIDTSNLFANKTLSRAATKFSKRVSRAFSFNKTPHNDMKRSVSTMITGCSPLSRETSLFGLQTLTRMSRSPCSSIASSSALASTSDLTFEGSDSYSGIVDQMSIGTPSMQKRRETLAGINYADLPPDSNTPTKKSVDNVVLSGRGDGGSGGTFVVPRSVNKLRPPLPPFVPNSTTATATSPYGTMRRNYSSTQSLYTTRAISKSDSSSAEAMSRTPSSTLSASKNNFFR